jgi:benzoyl-CoA 2,3-dioxygenase component B
MLREESFHLGTGHDGLKRIVKAEVVPLNIVQKYVNKWIPVSYDLFGVDQSSSAHWFYVWGLKGRYDEAQTQQEVDLGHMNEHNRHLYFLECEKLIEQINKHVPVGAVPLYVPDMKFNRHIGEFADQSYSVTGELLSPEKYAEHLKETLPQPEDIKLVGEIQDTEPKWVSPKGSMDLS